MSRIRERKRKREDLGAVTGLWIIQEGGGGEEYPLSVKKKKRKGKKMRLVSAADAFGKKERRMRNLKASQTKREEIHSGESLDWEGEGAAPVRRKRGGANSKNHASDFQEGERRKKKGIHLPAPNPQGGQEGERRGRRRG